MGDEAGFIKVDKLTYDNYPHWKFNMKMYLVGRDLWDIVEGTETLTEEETDNEIENESENVFGPKMTLKSTKNEKFTNLPPKLFCGACREFWANGPE